MSKIRALLYDENGAKKRLKAANIAMSCDREPATNRNKIVDTIDTIIQTDPEVELVIFGEMILGWYKPGRLPEYHRQISEPVLGETTQVLASAAKKHKIYVCFGMSESDGEALYNAQVLLNPQGEVQAVHRKRNLQDEEKEAGYRPGLEMVTMTDIKGVKTGIVICSDTASFRTMWELVKSRLELIIISLADRLEDDFVTKFQARLFDAWVITANRYGQEDNKHWPGLIVVTDPLGEILSAEQGQEQYLNHELYFADTGSLLQGVIRNVWVKLRLIVHVLSNLRKAVAHL